MYKNNKNSHGLEGHLKGLNFLVMPLWSHHAALQGEQ